MSTCQLEELLAGVQRTLTLTNLNNNDREELKEIEAELLQDTRALGRPGEAVRPPDSKGDFIVVPNSRRVRPGHGMSIMIQYVPYMDFEVMSIKKKE